MAGLGAGWKLEAPGPALTDLLYAYEVPLTNTPLQTSTNRPTDCLSSRVRQGHRTVG